MGPIIVYVSGADYERYPRVPPSVTAGGACSILSRFTDADGATLVNADVSAVRVDLYALIENVWTAVDADGEEITDSTAFESPAVNSVLFDAMQTDTKWTVDSVGYNFQYTFVPPLRDVQYDCRITLTVTGLDPVVIRQDFVSR